MCGPQRSDRPRHGALVALRVTDRPSLRADLIFHTPGHPASTEATHATLTPSSAFDVAGLRVVIHISGDLGRPVDDCGLFRALDLPGFTSANVVELPLQEPLSLAVGGSGIIGRRVSLCSRPACGSQVVLAEGIVGFNVA
ncbi:hypothetical protein L249_1885 [Ophiocordyceps polyrhachis-furcata BCC 54312]|uniref:Uncharacterized protein n=1 Tax=Ophiocordyceps polyrhachis-furcata BCC 54312 TaxID=1330021 RepID=A0A367LRJ3_9HYPO|nr:hypothetical protein L249_1885 [Ophiocordyceps polyrhachis-furcata BCC 54312]